MSSEREELVARVNRLADELTKARVELREHDLAWLRKTQIAISAERAYVRRLGGWECKVCGGQAGELSLIPHATDCILFPEA